mgnify:CR=1 FL=1
MTEDKLTWRKSEVLAYLEELVLTGEATDAESVLLENYHWTGKLNKNNTYKMIIRKMRKEWNSN